MPYREIISAAYDAGVEEEYNRLTDSLTGEAEYQLFIDLFKEYIPAGATVIDIGSGSGRYAEYLIKRNCRVGVVDLSAQSLKAFSDRLSDLKGEGNIIFNRVSCATQLEWIESNLADAILLMGPLYHLINEEHRVTALNHCRRILKKGGLLFSVFLSPDYHLNNDKIISNVKSHGESKTSQINSVAELVTYTRFQGYEVPQYRCFPEKVLKLMEANGFETVCMQNIELKVPEIHYRKISIFPDSGNQNFLSALLNTTNGGPYNLNVSDQFLYVGILQEKK
jgi:ubiquinone/menaquinone biosynthesis C-methylase UbiE